MALIVRNPDLADSISEVDIGSAEGLGQARQCYENGDIVLLKSARIDLDYAFLNSVDFDVDGPAEIVRKIKKFSGDDILEIQPRSGGEVSAFVFAKIFRGDEGLLRQFQAQVKSGNEQIYALYRRIFPGYREFKKLYTWRFTATLFENLHWDNFHSEDDFHQVRVFVNVDAMPRIWRISHKIDDYMQRHYAQNRLGKWARETPDRFNFQVNNKILGGMQRPLMDGLPLHHLAFEQGEIWLAETRIASHQIYCGRRAIASMFYVEPGSMDQPDKRFNARVQRQHAQAAAHASA
jgi:hypothetical protein